MTIGTVLSVVRRIHPSAASQEFSNAVLVVVEIDVGMNVVHPETLKDPVVASIFGTLLSLLTTAVVAFVLLGNSTSVAVLCILSLSDEDLAAKLKLYQIELAEMSRAKTLTNV